MVKPEKFGHHNLVYHFTFKRQPDKMIKHTQVCLTILWGLKLTKNTRATLSWRLYYLRTDFRHYCSRVSIVDSEQVNARQINTSKFNIEFTLCQIRWSWYFITHWVRHQYHINIIKTAILKHLYLSTSSFFCWCSKYTHFYFQFGVRFNDRFHTYNKSGSPLNLKKSF